MERKKTIIVKKMGKTYLTIIFGSCFLISQATILSILFKLNLLDVLILQTTFQSVEFINIISNWKSEGIVDYYLKHYYFDFFHPMFYVAFLISLLSKALSKNKMITTYYFMLYLPIIAGLFDVFENTLHLYMILNNSYLSIIIILSSILANSKWIIVFVCLVFSIYFLKRKHDD